MGLTFSAEHDELRRTVRAFFERWSPETEVRRLMATPDGSDSQVWARMAELGLLGLAVPEDLGGGGSGWTEVGIVLEEAGRALLSGPFLSTCVLATAALLHSDDAPAQKDYLPAIASGSCTATLAAPDRRPLPPTLTATASCDASGWRLDGSVSRAIDGGTADILLVAAATPGGASLFAVDRDAPGLRRTPLPTLDLTRKQARLDFARTPGRLIGAEGAGTAIVERTLDVTAVALAAEQVGVAERALEMAVDYAKVRHQFGQPIGSFQAVKHLCADMLVEVESARSAAHHGLWAADHDPAELPVAASLAQAYCSDAATFVATQNIQVHGGIGFTWEHPAHLYLKRAKTDQLLFGDGLHHRRLLGERIGLPC